MFCMNPSLVVVFEAPPSTGVSIIVAIGPLSDTLKRLTKYVPLICPLTLNLPKSGPFTEFSAKSLVITGTPVSRIKVMLFS